MSAEAKAAELAKYTGDGEVNRGAEEDYVGPTEDEVQTWAELAYKPFQEAESNSMYGFKSCYLGDNIFRAIWEHCAASECEPTVSSKSWKMKFQVSGHETEPMEACAEFSDEEEEAP